MLSLYTTSLFIIIIISIIIIKNNNNTIQLIKITLQVEVGVCSSAFLGVFIRALSSSAAG